MINKLNNNSLFQQIIKFGFVGGIAFIIDYITLIIFIEIFGISILISTAMAFSISVIFNYVASIKWVFNVNSNNSSKKNFILFIILSIVGLIITEIIMYIGTQQLDINYLIVKIFATTVVMFFNFITRKMFLENKGTDTIKKYTTSNFAKIIYAGISYISLCLFGILRSYDILSFIIFIFIIVIFIEHFKIDSKKYKGVVVLSFVFSLLTIFGN